MIAPPEMAMRTSLTPTKLRPVLRLIAVALGVLGTSQCLTAQAASAPAPLPTPSMTGPLQTASPTVFDAGLLGKLDLTGILSGIGVWQDSAVPGDKPSRLDINNGQVFIQKTSGVVQFYLQAGVYDIPALGTPFFYAGKTVSDFYGPLPLYYLKLAPTKDLSIQIGQLPTLIGAEYTFTFENVNVDRGLLWNQENAINRGVQINDAIGKLSVSVSWNDGFYSNRYTWITGTASYTINSAQTLVLVAGGNLGHAASTSVVTPVQNNGSIYNVIYTYSHGPWIIQPYYQHTDVRPDAQIGVTHGASTNGGALLLSYNVRPNVFLAGRGEYITSTGNPANGAVNVLYGPGSAAWSATFTPTYQNKGLFARADLALVQALSSTAGNAFGRFGSNRSQLRAVIETGFMF
jgi:hypothetical protein